MSAARSILSLICFNRFFSPKKTYFKFHHVLPSQWWFCLREKKNMKKKKCFFVNFGCLSMLQVYSFNKSLPRSVGSMYHLNIFGLFYLTCAHFPATKKIHESRAWCTYNDKMPINLYKVDFWDQTIIKSYTCFYTFKMNDY